MQLLLFASHIKLILRLNEDNEMQVTLDDIIDLLQTARIDIKNIGNEKNSINVLTKTLSISNPQWFSNSQGVGTVVKCRHHYFTLDLEIKNDGLLRLLFKGQDKSFEKERFPIWIDYKSIKIDDKEILSLPVSTWHNLPFRWEMPVIDGQKIRIEIEWTNHRYTIQEIKALVLKFYQSTDYANTNINQIVEEIFKSIGDGYSLMQINEYPRILADCFIPIGEGCRSAKWLRDTNLRFCSLPFDWMGGCSLNLIMKSIKKGISDWFIEYTEDPAKANKNCHFVYDTKNNFRSRHAFPINKTIEEFIPEFREIFGRRYERLLELLQQSKTVCFVCNNRSSTPYDFYIFLNELQKIYPNSVYYLLHVHHNSAEDSIKEYKFDNNITIYNIETYDIHKEGHANPNYWIGNEDLWTKICRNLFLTETSKLKLNDN